MSLDPDLEKLFESFSSEPKEVNQELAFLIYKYIPHNDHIDALEGFKKSSKTIMNDFLSEKLKLNITSEEEDRKLLESIINLYAVDAGWYLMYAEDLDEEIKIIVNEYFKNGQ